MRNVSCPSGRAKAARRQCLPILILGFIVPHARVLCTLVAAALLSSCGSDSFTGPEPKPEPRPQPGIRVAAGISTSDTIEATAAQGLVVEVRGADGKLSPGVVIRFETMVTDGSRYCTLVTFLCGRYPDMFVGEVGGDRLWIDASATTDVQGRATVRMQFGRVAGVTKIVVTAPELGLQDTVRFNVRPGAGVKAIAAPRDTTVSLGKGFAAAGLVVDRFGNVRPETAALSSGSGLRVEGGSVVPVGYGVHTLRAHAAGLEGDSTTVSVVPQGTLAVVRRTDAGDSIVVVDLDGSNRRALAMGRFVNGFDWAPDGSGLVASLGSLGPPRRLHTVALDGSTRPLLSESTAGDETLPVFTANGQWLFFVGANRTIWRARADGGGLEHIAVPNVQADRVGPSPDGSRVAVGGGYVLTPVHEISTGRTTWLFLMADAFRWLPSANQIAFYARHTGPGVIGTDGSGHRYFHSDNNGFESHFDISPDGRWIVFRAWTSLVLVEVETGRTIPLRHSAAYSQAAWKP